MHLKKKIVIVMLIEKKNSGNHYLKNYFRLRIAETGRERKK